MRTYINTLNNHGPTIARSGEHRWPINLSKVLDWREGSS